MVTFSSNNIALNKKRGISSIIGALIFLVLLTAGFSTFFIAMDVQTDTIEAQRSISDSIIDKTQEQFAIAVATDDSNGYKLGIQVQNQGPNPVEISDIWIINKTQVNQPIKKIAVNYDDAFIPGGTNSSILETQHLTMVPNDYDIKVISVLGTIQKSELKVGGNNYLLAEMFTIPPDVRLNENVTLALRVTNVGPTEITDIAPDLDFNPNGVEVGKVTWLSVPEFISQSPVDLKPSESVIFSWHSTLTNSGTVGEKVKFTNSASGLESLTGFGVSSNSASDKMAVQDDLGGASGEEVVLKDNLFAKPGIFMTIPNTFGDDNEEAIWAITVANPTDAPMIVSKITISVLFAGANDNQKILDKDCIHTNLAPLPDDYWKCPNQNQLVWYDSTSPFYTHTIPPRSAYTFLATVLPGDIVGSTEGLDSVVLHASVFTTLGAFGQTSWTSAMSKTTEALVNVFMTDDTTAPYTDYTQVKADRLGILPGSTQTFHIVLDDLNISSQHIMAGAQLIINVPKGWVVTPGSITDDGFTGTPALTTFSDTSSQIVGILTANLPKDGKMITFDAVAPSPSCEKMYIMHVLANGVTNNNRPIGPVSEIVLQVDPPGPCP